MNHDNGNTAFLDVDVPEGETHVFNLPGDMRLEPLTPAQLNHDLQRVVNSVIGNAYTFSRANVIREFGDSRRGIEEEAGYPKFERPIKLTDYKYMYEREPVATKVVEFMANCMWQALPQVFEDDDPTVETEFERAVKELGDSLRPDLLGGQTFVNMEEDNPIWEYIYRADINAGIGRYGVLFIGIDDGLPFSQPAMGLEEINSVGATSEEFPEKAKIDNSKHRYGLTLNQEATKGRKLIYLRPLTELQASIARYETNKTSPRFGMPLQYNINFGSEDESESGFMGGAAPPGRWELVHWSRVIHIADNRRSDDIFGVPRMRPVFNRLWDIHKISAAAGEGYWRNSIRTLVGEGNPALGPKGFLSPTSFRNAIENFHNSLQRYLLAPNGSSIKELEAGGVDPNPFIDACIKQICIQLDVPKRKFEGSERGELSSGQDDGDHNDKIRQRIRVYGTPVCCIPFFVRLVVLGVLPTPKKMTLHWPDLETQSPEEATVVMKGRVEAMAKYVAGNVHTLMAPADFLEREAGYNKEEVETILQNAEDYSAEIAEEVEDDLLEPEGVAIPQNEPNNKGDDDDSANG